MSEEPPIIHSSGDNPTQFGGDMPPPQRPFEASQGDAPTDWQVSQMIGFMPAGAELDPTLMREQKAVLLKPGDVVNDRFEVIEQLARSENFMGVSLARTCSCDDIA